MRCPQFLVRRLRIPSPFNVSNQKEKCGIEFSTVIVLREALQGIGEIRFENHSFCPILSFVKGDLDAAQ